ncbi:MAG TPA: mannosyltransferase family protein [Solirubrobacteraceae bacterium]
MSVGTASIRLARPGRALVETVRATSMPVRAFVLSRLLVLATGALGVMTMTKHAPFHGARDLLHQLGPVGNALAGSVDRFDANYYLDIASHGYGVASSGHLAFYPLYPLTIRVLSLLTGSGVLAGFLVSAVAFQAALILLHRLTELELGRRAADVTVLLLAFAPLSFFFTAVYTESLFLLLSVAGVFAARQGRWRLACGLGALATLTRPTGIVLLVALVITRVRARGGFDRSLAWALALPAALLGYMAFLAASGYGWLASFQAQSGWSRVTPGPVAGLGAAIWAALRGLVSIARGGAVYHPALLGPFSMRAESVILLGVLTVMATATGVALRRLPLAYGAYAAAVILLCVSSPEVGQPLWSLDRFALTLFPIWMVAGAWISARGWLRPALLLSSALLVFYTLQFSSWSFVA